MNQQTFEYLPPDLVQQLEGLEIAFRRPMAGMRQSQHRSDSLGAAVEFAEYREYYPGDPLNRLDWDVYARTDQYVVREAHEEISARCFVLLDISSSMAFGYEGEMDKSDYGRYLAASIMYIMVNQDDSAGIVTFDSSVHDFYEPTTTPSGLKPHLECLEERKTGGEGDIEAALHEVTEMIDSSAFIVLVSDLLQKSDRIRRGLHHLHHEEMDVTVFHIMDPAELTLPMDGLVELEDMETGGKMTIEPDEVRDIYVEQVNQHNEELRNSCTDLQMDYLFADTSTPVTELVMKRCV